jgi:hypothetical protein
MTIATATKAVAVGLAVSAVLFATPAQAATCASTFSTNLRQGATGADVKALQMFLNTAADTQVAATGAGSAGSETMFFGPATRAAVIKFQNKYAADILAPNGLTVGTGFVGASTRAKIVMMCGSTTTTNPTTPAPAGTGLTLAAGAPIQNALAPRGATRVPFTNFTVTAGTDGDVTVNSVAVQRVGLGQNAAFDGVTLINLDTGEQIGTAKTFNSNNQANIGAPMVVKAGTTVRLQVAANMAASLASYAGEAPAISVVGVNTTAAISGATPITGAYHTINATLSVGSLALDTSNAFAANSTVTSKEIGTVGFRVSGFRLTAGSSEDVRVKSIRWNQTGSVSSTDLANVKTFVGGTAYPTTVSTDGKYYSTNFGSGILVPKGNQVEVYLSYDIVGSNASGRTVIFDVDKTTDIFATGETYGYGISPAASTTNVPTTRGNTTETNGSPYIYANSVTVSGASVTTISKANEVPSQNIAINVPNQPLGAFVVDLRGEAMTVQSQVFSIASTTGGGSGLLTNVTLVDQNGAVIAGPVDAVYVNSTTQTVTFTDSVTYKTGRSVITLRGKVASGITNGGTYIVSTTPSTQWTNVKGDTTGNTISLATFSTAIAMNTMTVRAGALVVGPATSPASQTITPGGSSLLMANISLDAGQSGEDLRISSVPARLTIGGGAASTELTACQLFDGATALNTGSNTVNPSGASPADNTFTLDNPVTITKGTVKTLGIKCNVSGSATNNGTFAWAPGAATFVTGFSVQGATSGTTITPTATLGTAPTFTVGTGSFVASLDASTPSYKLAAANTTGSTNTVMKLRATNEDVTLTELGLELTNTASSTAADLTAVTIWDGATQVGSATFSSGSSVATSTLTTPVTLTKNTDKVLTIRANFAAIGTGEPVTFSGRLVAIDFDGARGTGAQSGNTLWATGSTVSNGTRVFKSFPTIALDTLSSTGLAEGKLMRFRVTADAAGPVGITQFGINVATTTASLTNITIYGFEDSSYSTAISGVSASGNLQAVDDTTATYGHAASPNVTIGVTTSGGTATAIQVPAGATRYFEVRASVSGSTTGASVTTRLLGQSSFVTGAVSAIATNPLVSAGNAGFGATDFVWSPNSTSTAVRADQDWTNGFGVAGLPSGGLVTTRSH